ncbi:MAG: chemotaxis protein CheW [Cellvibrio sp.]|nr:chemotaxis protein CheW [Cellvibrio sp.]
MIDTHRIEGKTQEIASLLVPMNGNSLLIPNVTVAEIVPVSQVTPVLRSPDWYLGTCRWREQTVPLLAYEVLNGDEKPFVNARSRFAVLNTTGMNDSLPFIAVLTQGLPRLARVTDDEIGKRDDIDNKEFELMHISWAGEEAVIPNIPKMESFFLEYLRNNQR